MRIPWILGALLLTGCATASDVEQRAREALQPLKQRLMGELTRASTGGPENAIDACRIAAPAIAAELSVDGIHLGRTSHRLRNPANAPRPWMEPLLAAYLADPAGATPRVVEIDAQTAGYVEPITVQQMCLSCHGSELSPAVAGALKELYPRDDATGFAAGDFRGMLWVTLPAETP